MRGKARFVTPARHYGTGDTIKNIIAKNFYRKTIGDYCDLCLPKLIDVRIQKRNFGLRARGYKFICLKCAGKLRKEHGSLKGLKYIADFKYYIRNKKRL